MSLRSKISEPAGAASLPSRGTERLALAVLCGVLLLIILGPVLRGLPFADDWANRIDDPHTTLRNAARELRPYELYRPLQSFAMALSQVVSGGSGFLHVLQIAVHAGLTLGCLAVLSACGADRLALLVTAAYMTFSQLNGSALGGNDTFSLVLGTAAGLLSVAFAYLHRARGGGGTFRR